MKEYDLIVVGGGPGGYHAAALGVKRGLEVLLVEKDELGGTCLNRGCIPTKSFCASAESAEGVRNALEMGIELPGLESVRPDMRKIVERKNRIVEGLREGVAMVVGGAEVYRGTARFTASKVIALAPRGEGEPLEVTGKKIIVASGSEAATLRIAGAGLAVDSTAMLELESVPASLAVIGGGVIGMEFASIFASLGSEVTVIEYCKEILPPFDKDIAKRLRMTLQKRGVRFSLGAEVKSIEAGEGVMRRVEFQSKGKPQSIEAEVVLMAVGRRPVIPEGMAEAGYAINGRGALEIDGVYRTNVEGVYAVGDCNGESMLAHAASAQAELVMGGNVDLSVIPSAVFTYPECAMVGMTEERCKDEGMEFRVGKSFFRANGKACAMGESEGLVKVIVDAGSGRILGAGICGAHASDLIAEVALAMAAGLTAGDVTACVHSHPSLSEAVAESFRGVR